MLIQLGTVIFDTSEIKLIAPAPDGGSAIHLSTVGNGRRLTLPAELASRLTLFLRASGLVDLNGASYNAAAFEAAANLHEELQKRGSIRNVFTLSEQKNAADAALTALANVHNNTPPPTVNAPQERDPAVTAGPSLVPRPAPPALPTAEDEDPDPMLFIPKSGRRLTPSILDGL